MEITEENAEIFDKEQDEESNEIDRERELDLLKKLEAALFISGRFMNLKELVSITDINPILLRKLLQDLEDRYKDSAIEIVHKTDSWKMDVNADYAAMVNKLASGSSEFSKAEQETLAIIAYKQPIKQSVLVKIRGNKAYDHIKNFSGLGLITKKRTGHTWELNLSDSFYEYFHVGDKDIVEGVSSSA